MNSKYIFVGMLFCLLRPFQDCNGESITFISTEHPVIMWYDQRYFKNISLISRRTSRQDFRYYVELYFDLAVPMGNNVTLDFYFYQFLTNRYRPSFVEMHFKLCDMIESDGIFGSAMKKALGNTTCPLQPGPHDLRNMYIPYVPKGFPFNKGRIYCNVTFEQHEVPTVIGSGSVDMEIKVAVKKNSKKQ